MNTDGKKYFADNAEAEVVRAEAKLKAAEASVRLAEAEIAGAKAGRVWTAIVAEENVVKAVEEKALEVCSKADITISEAKAAEAVAEQAWERADVKVREVSGL